MPDVIKPGPPGEEGEDEQEEDRDVTLDVMGSRRDFPLQVSRQCIHSGSLGNLRHVCLPAEGN